ncbi:MAG TPA: alpha/beta-hydrolase family protein [Candidatus Corynebacterium avicola]|uniref:Alpha/beta-hydrolase family protein n=1 Tax=Candidatus Corynebacterium avicola TaxID=2838527 RepID=A0A9D1RPS4_9CORY|nr:alpha/beta-hydrolase family protein [Candidatus Corynebacterium avicola]
MLATGMASLVLVLNSFTALTGMVWWIFDDGPLAQSPRDVLTEESEYGAVRVFGDRPGEDTETAAQETVDDLVAADGLDRDVVVVALPTGSGWVDPDQVEAVEQWADGDVATVSVRYARVPSAVAYLLRPELAEQSATHLLEEVVDRVGELPEGERPEIVVHGQSLGVAAGTAAMEAVSDTSDEGTAVSAALWQGRPGTVSAPEDAACTVDSVNADDPVGALGWGLLTNPVAGVGVLADMPGSESATPGTLHTYLPVLPPDGCVGEESRLVEVDSES